MIKALLSVRLRGLFGMFLGRGGKKNGAGKILLFAFLYIYLLVVLAGAMFFVFSSLIVPYHAMGFDWLYFAMASVMALGFSLIGSVFTTQNQLYDAKDNELLLSMPVTPAAILLSRMVSLLLYSLLFAAVVMLPAMLTYIFFVGFYPLAFLFQLLTLLGVTMLSQTIACVLGWLLHLLLSRMNKSVASMLYMVIFMVVYFSVYSQAGNILNNMALNGAAIGSAMQSWAWPLYAAGAGCSGSAVHLLAFLAIAVLLFVIVFRVLSRTFLSAATAKSKTKRRSLRSEDVRTGTVPTAMWEKELRRFLSTPVYFTNMGFGLIIEVVMLMAAFIFRGKLQELLAILPAEGLDLTEFIPLIICAALCFSGSMNAISTPSVSLEGKTIWILKSMPVPARTILEQKLMFHIRLTAPIAWIVGMGIAAILDCGEMATVLCGLCPALFAVLNGVLGMLCGLLWAKLDWVSEAYACKQSVSVLVVMFGMMGLPVLLGLAYFLLLEYGVMITTEIFLSLTAVLLAVLSLAGYRLMVTWGVKKWESLN